MKKLKAFLMIMFLTAFSYVAAEQWIGIDAIFNRGSYRPMPVSSVVSASQVGETKAQPVTLSVKIEAGQKADQMIDFYEEPREALQEAYAEELEQNSIEQNSIEQDGIKRITITAAGDCLLGFDAAYGFTGSFMDEYEKQGKDCGYFLRNFADLFDKSDLTIVNLESPLTTSNEKADKEFVFKGLPEFTDILKLGNVDAVTIANNHTKDYGLEGYHETVGYLEEAGLLYFGNEYTALTEVKGIKIGMFGYSTWYIDNGIKKNILKQIGKLREMGADLVIAYFHWGEERAPLPNDVQRTYAYFAIENGVDLVLGTHPHVIQGIEEYMGKQIVYSFGNFCYGGAKNPSDKDTFVFQQTFSFADGRLLPDANIEIIPTSISSVGNRNNYQPTPLKGDDYFRVLQKITERSEGINMISAQ